jgi:hypothetical protein
MDYKKGKYSVHLTNEKNQSLINQDVEFTINGRTYIMQTDDKGIASLNINLYPGNYPISYKYLGNIGYSPCSGESRVIVVYASVKLNSDDMNISYDSNSYYSVELTRADGEELAKRDINLEISGNGKVIKQTITTYENGVAKFFIDLSPGEYIFKSSFRENYFEEGFIQNKIIITKANIIFESKDLILNRKGESFLVTLINNETQKPISNQEVEISINGPTYLRTTDNYGTANLPINLDEKNYTIYYKFKGNEGYYENEGFKNILMKNIKLNAQLTPLNYNISRKGTEFKVLLEDINGIPLKNEIVYIKIN